LLIVHEYKGNPIMDILFIYFFIIWQNYIRCDILIILFNKKGGNLMVYEFAKYPDETLVVFSDI